MKKILSCLKNSIYLICKYSKLYLLITLVCMIFQGIIPAILIVIMQNCINLLQKSNVELIYIFILLLIYIGLNILNSIISHSYQYYSFKFNLNFTKNINIKSLEKIDELSVEKFENSEVYDLIDKAQMQGATDILTYVSQIFFIFKELITMISIGTILVKFEWWVIFLVLLIPVIQCISTIYIDKKWYIRRKENIGFERQKWYINFLMLKGHAIKEIKIFELTNYFIEKYKKISENIIHGDIKLQKLNINIMIFLECVDWFLNGFIYIFLFIKGLKKSLLIGDIMAYIDGIEKIKTSSQGIFYSIESIVEQSLYLDILFNFFEIKGETNEGKIKISDIESIEFINVSYKYNDDRYALKNINFKLSNNENIAIVGENGSGKTTLIKLILGLYKNYEGEILINDIDLKKIDIIDYRKKVSCIFQDYVKYEMSIRENIGFGDVNKMYDDDYITEQVDKVQLNSVIKNNQYLDMNLGSWFGKVELSGGEWQRVAVARMFMKDAKLVVLDEPDSSLDIKKQNELIKIYKKEMENKISIYVSHKIEYVNLVADNIYVLSDGYIIEKGTHSSLVEKHGEYFEMLEKSKYKYI